MRYLGLDVGRRAIGVAAGEILAEELTTIRCAKNKSHYENPDKERAFTNILKLADQQKVAAIIVGLPVNQDGEMTQEAKLIKTFSEELASRSQIPVKYVNETLTSFMAEDILSTQGLKKDKIKERIDQLSAKLILQQYLEDNESI